MVFSRSRPAALYSCVAFSSLDCAASSFTAKSTVSANLQQQERKKRELRLKNKSTESWERGTTVEPFTPAAKTKIPAQNFNNVIIKQQTITNHKFHTWRRKRTRFRQECQQTAPGTEDPWKPGCPGCAHPENSAADRKVK